MFSSELNERFGGIASYDRGRIGVTADRVCQGSSATPNIQPMNVGRNPEPGHKARREVTAPPAHEVLVGGSGYPSIASVGHLVRHPPMKFAHLSKPSPGASQRARAC